MRLSEYASTAYEFERRAAPWVAAAVALAVLCCPRLACASARARAYLSFYEGNYGGDIVAWERLRIQYWSATHGQQKAAEIRGVHWRDSVLRRPWWALARLQRWRLRAWADQQACRST